MINQIWAALIIIGIIFAASLSLRMKPTEETPPPVVPASFEQLLESVELESATIAVGEGHEDEARGVAIPYDVAEGTARVDLGVTIERNYPFVPNVITTTDQETVAPTKLEFWTRGGVEGHALRIGAVDTHGFEFYGPSLIRLSGGEGWSRRELALSGLTPAPDFIGASPTYPLELFVEVVPSRAAEETIGTVGLSGMTLGFGEILHRSSSYSSDSWGGVVSESVVSYARISINLAIGLIGIMMLWLGLMKIAEAAGLVRVLANLVKPIMVFLFPDIPKDSPAMGAILMNVAANMLGLGNAATPLGIKAMKMLQEENPSKEYASNAQCMLLAINTSSVTLIPVAIIGYRAALGSQNLFGFWLPMVLTTLCSTIVAVTACKILEKLPAFQIPAAELARQSLDKKIKEDNDR